MYEANGLDASRHGHVRDAMVELIKIVEGFFACGVAASVYGLKDESGNIQPDSVFSNVGKLLLATQIYDMQRLAHYVSGGLVVALPGPDEDHNPATQARLSAVLAGRQDIPARRRLEVARLLEDLTASDSAGWYSIISLHGGGSPEAMKREIWRQYPLEDKVALVEGLLERGVAGDIARPAPVSPAAAVLPAAKCRSRHSPPPRPPKRRSKRSQRVGVPKNAGAGDYNDRAVSHTGDLPEPRAATGRVDRAGAGPPAGAARAGEGAGPAVAGDRRISCPSTSS